MLKISFDLAEVFLKAMAAAVNTGEAASLISIWGGPIPDTVEESVTASNLHLAEFALLRPAFADPVVETTKVTMSMLPVDSCSALDAGIATFFRLYDGAGVPVLQGTVGLIGSGETIEISEVDVTKGMTLDVVDFTLAVDVP